MKGMREKQILAVIKEPGKAPRVEPLLDNELKAFQEVVGGHIETVTLATDLVIICNEEGRLHGLPFNCAVGGIEFVGTIMAVSQKDEEFASIQARHIPMVLQLLGGRQDGQG